MKNTIVAVLAAAALTASCADPVAPPAPTPARPSITDTFTGTLQVSGTNVHSFTIQQLGDVDVTVSSIDPSTTLGIGVGTTNGASCSVLERTTTGAGATAQLQGTATIGGSFCVAVYDVGNLVEPVTYTVVVLHP